MLVNSSSDHLSSSNSSIYPLWSKCFTASWHVYIFSAFLIINILLIPVLILVLYRGYQQWGQQRSVPTAATISHTDCLTYHSVVIQLNGCLGFAIFFCGSCFDNPEMTFVGLCAWSVTSLGQVLVHLLTCVVRYLAVVHPITFMSFMKKTSGVRTGNISIGCVWLLCFTGLIISYESSSMFNIIMHSCIVVFVLIVISFCCISVLCALKRPAPGEVVGDKERVDHSKQKAFNSIMIIMGVLWFRFWGNLICDIIFSTVLMSTSNNCVGFMTTIWFDLPSCLVLPLLFLHRAGKLQCCKQTTESG